ncbi:hypothetical protein ABZ215_04390 [Amycolatopsis sp. NPDC006131]|uniref:hypothetical protein n=1 Tax=Amycolatopsis sp. NPDC006131 TaxID=3156731 RepID=UPI0033BC537D
MGRKLAFSASAREVLQKMGLSAAGPEPDVILRHPDSGDHLVLECKAQSFSATSTTAQQGRKLLLACSDSSASLGAAGNAYVVYVVDSSDVDKQRATLKQLSAEIASHDAGVAKSGTIGLSIDNRGLWAELSIEDLGAEDSPAGLCSRVLVVEGAQEEVRPLYLIPFDPAAENEQSPEERRYCARLLAERLFVQAIKIVGRADLPECVQLPADVLLTEATFGVARYWEAGELPNFKARIAKYLYRRLNRGVLRRENRVSLRRNIVVELDLANESDREIVISMLHRTDPERLAEDLLDKQIDVTEQVDPDEFD